MRHRIIGIQPYLLLLLFSFAFLCRCAEKPRKGPLPEAYRQSGSFIRTLPYYNPDSCVLLIKRDVPPQWQGAAYQNLFLDGPEDSPMELAYQHLDTYEKNFPADSARAFVQLYRGLLLEYDNLLDSALACVNDAYAISQRAGLPLLAFDAQLQLASIQISAGKTAEPIRAYLAAYEAIKEMDSSQTDRKILVMNKLASAYSISNDQREALAWLQRCSPLVEDESAPAMLANKVDHLMRKAIIYNRLELPDSAILMAQKGLDLQEKHQTNNSRSSLMYSMGIAYLAKGDCQKSLEQLLATMHEYQDIYTEKDLAKAYLCVGQLDSAEHYYKRVAEGTSGTTRSEADTRLGEIYAKQGRYELAYRSLRESLDFREKNFNVQKVQEIGAAKAELELERTRHQLAEEGQQRQNARLQTLLVASLLLMALGLSVALYLRQRSRRRILEQENQLLAQEKELALTRERLNILQLERTQADLSQSKESLKTTQQELDNAARLLALKNQIIEELHMILQSQDPVGPTSSLEKGASFNRELYRMKILTDNDWNLFRQRFNQSFPNFLPNLKSNHPTLTAAETRLLLLIKLGFDVKEIAGTLGISQESVYRSRHRLAKKIGLNETGELDKFIADMKGD